MSETDVLNTLSVDQLMPGDQIRLVGMCEVLSVQKLGELERIVHVRTSRSMRELGVWLWKYSRVVLLSDVLDRRHLITPIHTSLAPEPTESVA